MAATTCQLKYRQRKLVFLDKFMPALISWVLADGTGFHMSGRRIILKARQNTSAVVMRTVATVVTG